MTLLRITIETVEQLKSLRDEPHTKNATCAHPVQNTVSEQHSSCPICRKPTEWLMSLSGWREAKLCCIQEQRAKT